tara:strand:+ start:1293 stop:2129 length:837 start_codon:yes stop_codon:yes gene_type:complete
MENHEPIWFDQEDNKTQTNEKPYSIFVATPVHSEVSIHYTKALLELQKHGFKNGYKVYFQIMKSSLVTQGRNMCVSAFLQSKATHMLFIDSDIAFEPGAAQRLVNCNKQLISIPYPLKDMNYDKAFYMIQNEQIKSAKDLENKAFYRYPMKVPDNNAIKVENGCIEVTHSPTGFMMIRRDCLEKMIEHYGESMRIDQDQIMNGKNERLPHFYNFFDTMYIPEKKHYLGEDFAFCKRWKDIGGKCYAWVNDYLAHVGEHRYTGRFADELITNQNSDNLT